MPGRGSSQPEAREPRGGGRVQSSVPITYQPKPIDTSSVELPSGLDPLLERLAEHSHEVWALGRIAEGWRYGPRRDDDLRTHPCLVPYGDLPDSEKRYDRAAATESLKALLKLGYRIVPPV